MNSLINTCKPKLKDPLEETFNTDLLTKMILTPRNRQPISLQPNEVLCLLILKLLLYRLETGQFQKTIMI